MKKHRTGRVARADEKDHRHPAIVSIENWCTGFLFPNRRKIGYSVAVVVVVVFAVLVVRSKQAAKLSRAYVAFADAEEAEDFQSVAEEFRGTTPGVLASLERARMLLETGDAAASARAFAEFHSGNPGHPMVEAARVGEAYALEANGQLGEAEKLFAEIAESSGNSNVSADAFCSAGRCAKTRGKLAQAGTYYERAVGVAPGDGSTGDRAEKALEHLRVRLAMIRSSDADEAIPASPDADPEVAPTEKPEQEEDRDQMEKTEETEETEETEKPEKTEKAEEAPPPPAG